MWHLNFFPVLTIPVSEWTSDLSLSGRQWVLLPSGCVCWTDSGLPPISLLLGRWWSVSQILWLHHSSCLSNCCLPLLLPSNKLLACLLLDSIWGRRGDVLFISQAVAGWQPNRATHSCWPCHWTNWPCQSEQTSPQRLRSVAERGLQAGNSPKKHTECSSWISTWTFQITVKVRTWDSGDRHSQWRTMKDFTGEYEHLQTGYD